MSPVSARVVMFVWFDRTRGGPTRQTHVTGEAASLGASARPAPGRRHEGRRTGAWCVSDCGVQPMRHAHDHLATCAAVWAVVQRCRRQAVRFVGARHAARNRWPGPAHHSEWVAELIAAD